MITTREIDASKDDRPKRLKQKTTKEINVKSIDDGKPLKPAAGPMVTTHNIEGFQAKAAAQERMAKARAAKKEKK